MKREKTKEELEYAEVKKSKIHNTGIFAKKDIPKNTLIIEYKGEKITKKESEKRSDEILNESKKNKNKGAVYIFELNKKYDLDGNVPYNPARYINHSCEPNSESEIIDEKIWIRAIKNIKKGEEILYNYGYDIDNYEEHPCKCGKEKCIGYIASEDKWEKLKKKIKQKYKNKKVLLTYYSRTGNTKKIIQYLKEYFNFEIDEIKTNPRKGITGYIKSAYESTTNKKPKITKTKNPQDYEIIILGTPIWANTISSPINTYLQECKNQEIIAICTQNKNNNKAFNKFLKENKSFKGQIQITTHEIKNNTYQNKLINFIKNIELN